MSDRIEPEYAHTLLLIKEVSVVGAALGWIVCGWLGAYQARTIVKLYGATK